MADYRFVLIARTSKTTGNEVVFTGIAVNYAAALLKRLGDPQCHILQDTQTSKVTAAPEMGLMIDVNKATYDKCVAVLKAVQERDKPAASAKTEDTKSDIVAKIERIVHQGHMSPDEITYITEHPEELRIVYDNFKE